MIIGTDYSYTFAENLNITGDIKLYSDELLGTKAISSLSNTFYNCPKIESVTFCDLNNNKISYSYSGVETYTWMSYEENIQYTDTKNISYDFYQYTDETTLGINYLHVETMDNMFKNCYNIKTVDMRGIGFNNCKSLNSMFENCYNLKTVYFGEQYPNINCNCENIFRNCYSLESVYIPSNFQSYYSNVIEQSNNHAYIYNPQHIDFEPHIENYTEKITSSSQTCYTKFSLKRIGCLLSEYGMYNNGKYFQYLTKLQVQVLCNGKLAYAYIYPDVWGKDTQYIYNEELFDNISFSMPSPLKSFSDYDKMAIVAFVGFFHDGYNDLPSESIGKVYADVTDKRFIDLDVDYIYFCNGTQEVGNFINDTTRVVKTTGKFHNENYDEYSDKNGYDYPDYNMMKIIDAKTSYTYYDRLSNHDNSNTISYIYADATYSTAYHEGIEYSYIKLDKNK